MQRISGLIGKEAITLAGAAYRGTVLNVYFDAGLNKCKYLTLVCDDDSDECKWVAYKSLCALDNDAVVIRSEGCILDRAEGNLLKSPVNLPAFNQDGVLLGVVRDIELDGDRAVTIITDLKTVPVDTLLSMSGELLVFNDTGAPVKLKKTVKKEIAHKPAPPQPAKKSADIPINNNPEKTQKTVDNALNSVERIIETILPTKKNDWLKDREIKIPAKIPPEQTEVYRSPSDNTPDDFKSRYYFLLGKRVQRPILSRDGQTLAQENAIVDEAIIRRAKEHGKLVMLALHSL